MTMPAFTVWQPWASLIALGHKPYEFRGHPAAKAFVGKRVAIHAGKRAPRRDEVQELILRLRGDKAWTTGLLPEALPFLEQALQNLGALPTSHIVCTAILGEPVISTKIAEKLGGLPVNDSDRDWHANWAWPMLDVEPLEPPVAARGAQGFWRWTP